MKIARQDVPTLLRLQEPGAFYTVVFTKRTTGETRVMNCRQGVKKHLKGGEAAYNFSVKGLVPVFDVQKGAYRCFPLAGVIEIRTGGKTYKVEG